MNVIDQLNGHPLVQPLGWALLHFVWQGLAIAGMLAILMRARGPRGAPLVCSAAVRYLTACAALLLMAACPILTMIRLSPGAIQPAALLPGVHVINQLPLVRPISASRPIEFHPKVDSWLLMSHALQPQLPFLVAVWLLGVLVLSLRMVGGWIVVQRMHRRGTRTIGEETGTHFVALVRQMGIRCPVRLLESATVPVPIVIGWLRVAVLVPVGALSGLPAQQLEALLVHELAHIRRHDYLVNLVQTGIETLLFYHPAVWWVSQIIRVERENCCDDLVVSFLGDRVTYARALTSLEELRRVPGPLALAANSSRLLPRIRRILGLPSASAGLSVSWIGGMIVVTLLLAAVVGVSAAKPVTPKAAEPAQVVPKPATDKQPSLNSDSAHQPHGLAAPAKPVKARPTAPVAHPKPQEIIPAPLRTKTPQALPRLATPPQPVPHAFVKRPPSGVKVASAAPSQPPTGVDAKGKAAGAKAAPSNGKGVVKGVPGRSIQDVTVLDLRGVPPGQVAGIRSIKDVVVVLVDAKNHKALQNVSLEDVGTTVVAGPNARVMVEPFVEFSKDTLAGMPARQELILVGVVQFKPDVTPELINQKLASLNVTGVVLSQENTRGALLGRMQIAGQSVVLPDNPGPVTHSFGSNTITPAFLERLPDQSVYVNIGATEIASEVTEAMLGQKIKSYVNIGQTVGPLPLINLMKSRSVANFGAFEEKRIDRDKN
jgi:beta-lactamase regulating signal transducer with metallopeptidase domain